MARRYLARTVPGARAQSRPRFLLSAARAAATAASTSSAVPAGISPARARETQHQFQAKQQTSTTTEYNRRKQRWVRSGAVRSRTDVGLGGGVDDGEAAALRGRAPLAVDEELPQRDHRWRGHR